MIMTFDGIRSTMLIKYRKAHGLICTAVVLFIAALVVVVAVNRTIDFSLAYDATFSNSVYNK